MKKLYLEFLHQTEFHMFHRLYKVFVFFSDLPLTIVDPLSATIALPGSQIISGKLF